MARNPNSIPKFLSQTPSKLSLSVLSLFNHSLNISYHHLFYSVHFSHSEPLQRSFLPAVLFHDDEDEDDDGSV